MDMKQVISLLSEAALLLVVVSVGMRAQWRDVLATARYTGLLARGILAVSVVVPMVAVGMCMLLPLNPAIKIGITVLAVSPLAPMTTGKMVKSGVEASRAVGLYVALVAVAVLMVPATVALLSWLLPPDASVSLAPLIRLIALSVLAPLMFGLVIGTWAPEFARRAAPIAMTAGYVALAILAVPIIVSQFGKIVGLLGNGTIVAMAVTVAAGLIAGHLLGGPEPETRKALALAAATRHPGIAAVIVERNFADSRVMLAVMLFVLVGMIGSVIYLQWQRISAGRVAGTARPA